MLSPGLPIDDLAATFARERMVRIPSILIPDAARQVRDCLERQTPWCLAFLEGGRPVCLSPGEVRAMDPRERSARVARIHAEACDGFQFLYNTYMMVEAYRQGRDPHLILHRLLEVLAGEDFVRLVRRVTGKDDLRRVDAQATRYLAGHFLGRHDDHGESRTRRVAYVLGLSPGWRPEWGGLLHFHDADGGVTRSFVPAYNVLTLFEVPAMHSVSWVAPFAGAARYSITGWLKR